MEGNNLNQFESDYLNRIVSTVKKSEGEQERKMKEKVIAEVNYKDRGQIHEENEKIVFDLGYEDSGFAVHPEEDDGSLVPLKKEINWLKLNNYSIKSKQSGVSIDLLSELPADYEVFFDPCPWYPNGEADVQGMLCYVTEDVASVNGLLCMLHEIGHCVDYEQAENRKEWRVKSIKDFVKNEKDMEYLLRRERGAWAYALKKIKPLIKDGIISKEDVMLRVNDSVYSYHKFLGDKIKKEEEKELDDKIVQAVEDFFAKITV
jgi:hypothetical protein